MAKETLPTTEETPKFDTRVTHRDHMGKIIKRTPYILRVVAASGGGKTELYERPVGSGNIYDGEGRPFGRWVNGKHDEKALHVTFIPPETSDQKLARSLVEQKTKIEQLEKELAAIKAEGKPSEEKKKY